MTAMTAYDECIATAERYERCAENARKIGSRRVLARFERRAMRARAVAAEWLAHPALRCTVEPSRSRPGVFVVRGHDRRFVLADASLFGAQRRAEDWGFRFIDMTACGNFA